MRPCGFGLKEKPRQSAGWICAGLFIRRKEHQTARTLSMKRH